MTSAFEREYAAAARQYSDVETNSAEKLLTDSKPAPVAKSKIEMIAESASAFGNGFLHSIESSYNGAAQLVAGNNYKAASISRPADKSSSTASYSYMAGEVVGAGLQLVALSKVLPKSTSIVGSIANRGAAGAIYGGVFVPSEGNDIASERLRSGMSMAAFMTTYEAARIGSYGLVGPINSLSASAFRGGIAGGVGAGSQVLTESALDGKVPTVERTAEAVTKGILMGAAMEFTSGAIARTDVSNMGRGGFEGARGPATSQRVDLNVTSDLARPDLLLKQRLASSTGRVDLSRANELSAADLLASQRAATFAGVPGVVTH